MQERIYLDSNILISIFKDEIGFNFRFLANEAQEFIINARKNNSMLIVSELLFQEVENKTVYTKEQTSEYLNSTKVVFEEINLNKQEFIEAREFEKQGIHYPDSVHLKTALKAKCNCIATFNKKDFEKANHLIEIKEPNEFEFI